MDDRRAPEPLLTYHELAQGQNDSVRHLRRLVNEDRIPFVKVAHFIRFDGNQITRWLDRQGGDRQR